ncbi:MAG: hypothetical protein IT381_33300 [Deltaproteobacteria bacterium]|nr:hypothetical protein [Deltaproteobacteria bacterium]
MVAQPYTLLGAAAEVGSGVLEGHWGFVWAAHALGLATLLGYGLYLVVKKPKG